jgi:hypothetical protein
VSVRLVEVVLTRSRPQRAVGSTRRRSYHQVSRDCCDVGAFFAGQRPSLLGSGYARAALRRANVDERSLPLALQDKH